jgi:hypothetical protein
MAQIGRIGAKPPGCRGNSTASRSPRAIDWMRTGNTAVIGAATWEVRCAKRTAKLTDLMLICVNSLSQNALRNRHEALKKIKFEADLSARPPGLRDRREKSRPQVTSERRAL